ncbi:S1C family serine protease [Pedobacter chinensis]|nr:trypsin-like peptidase domain-containing protein [Pedobacter chinensis]
MLNTINSDIGRYLKLAVFFVLLLSSKAFAQRGKAKRMESAVVSAMEKAYSASVKIWGFDTTRNERTSAQFSGVVVTAEGHILTAAHTIRPGKSYKVFFPDGKDCIAIALARIEVKETPGIPDVGMMKIISHGSWPYAAMGFSSTLQKGQTCLSISYPESLNQNLPTLRLGKIVEIKNQYGFIQSTCKMEPGDSGGSLFDLTGKVIGLHSAIDVSEDMNFEIPVDLYRKYWSALLSETNYDALPKQEERYKEKTLTGTARKKNKVENLVPDHRTNIKAFTISSFIDQKISEVSATFFDLIDSVGKLKQVLITKSSLVGDSAKLKLQNTAYPLKVLARNKDNDLVMLETDIRLQGGIDLKRYKSHDESKIMGKILFTVQQNGALLPSIAASNLINLPKISSLPSLGAMVAYQSCPAIFSLIKDRSPAEQAGLKVGDEVLSVDSHLVSGSEDFVSIISSYWPDDKIEMKWKRDGEIHTGQIQLRTQMQGVSNHPVEKFIGGKSKRRDGFTNIYAHDLALLPEQIGTAVFNIDEHFLGINIARFSRAVSLIMPVQQINDFINHHLKQTQ